jgi:hypothetical protein
MTQLKTVKGKDVHYLGQSNLLQNALDIIIKMLRQYSLGDMMVKQ